MIYPKISIVTPCYNSDKYLEEIHEFRLFANLIMM